MKTPIKISQKTFLKTSKQSKISFSLVAAVLSTYLFCGVAHAVLKQGSTQDWDDGGVWVWYHHELGTVTLKQDKDKNLIGVMITTKFEDNSTVIIDAKLDRNGGVPYKIRPLCPSDQIVNGLERIDIIAKDPDSIAIIPDKFRSKFLREDSKPVSSDDVAS